MALRELFLDQGLFGIETEYGIAVEGAGANELMDQSRLLVEAAASPCAHCWNYGEEDPRRDMRGFRVDQLNYDHRDALLDRGSQISGAAQRADQILQNGARFYNDHGHPEYATPECRTLTDLVLHDRAGELLLLKCAQIRSEQTGRAIRIFKNNTDYHGVSYGCHESYLFPRDLPFEQLLHGMLPFLCTRSLLAGAGMVQSSAGAFHLSQRASFFSAVASVDTLAQRPVFNTRDEPHADPARFRRIHVICGDANLSQWATAMKAGTTRLALALISSGWHPLFSLRDPARALQQVSHCPAGRALLELEDGRELPVLEIQRIYLNEIEALLPGAGGEWGWVLAEWRRALDDLEQDPERLIDRVDWAAKLNLLRRFMDAEGLTLRDPVIAALDLEYHDLDPGRGLHRALESAGEVVQLVSDEAALQALEQPPAGTRAALRGELVRRRAPDIRRISWGSACLQHGDDEQWYEFPVETGAPGAGSGPESPPENKS